MTRLTPATGKREKELPVNATAAGDLARELRARTRGQVRIELCRR
jgi:hypothetical protein